MTKTLGHTLILSLLALSACTRSGAIKLSQLANGNVIQTSPESAPIPQPTTTTTPAPTPTLLPVPAPSIGPTAAPLRYLTPYAKTHEAKWPVEYDEYVKNVIPNSMLGLNPPAAVGEICKNFYGLTFEQQRTVWAYLFQAISVPESAMNPFDRYVETAMTGNDPITGAHIASEGLLQLSYQDQMHADPLHLCKFDWTRDQHLSINDHAKTIFDPQTNLQCGVSIMSMQLSKKKTVITHGTAYYWSTLNEKTGSSGYASFQAQMKGAPAFCGN